MKPRINLIDPGSYERDGMPHGQPSWLRQHTPAFLHRGGGAVHPLVAGPRNTPR